MIYKALQAACIAAVACLVAGCGGKSGYDVSGSVTFKGQPVPAGKIYLMPDSARGNNGPTGYATIENGKYDTSAAGGKPVAGGPMVIGIEGFDPAAKAAPKKRDTSGEEIVQALFPYYEMKKDLPKESTTADFDVPAAAAQRKDRPDGPQVR